MNVYACLYGGDRTKFYKVLIFFAGFTKFCSMQIWCALYVNYYCRMNKFFLREQIHWKLNQIRQHIISKQSTGELQSAQFAGVNKRFSVILVIAISD